MSEDAKPSGEEALPNSSATAGEEAEVDGAAPASSWGFPRFAKDFPRHPELDALVAAFTRGDYATVRARAPRLAKAAESEAVRRAARLLRERIEPDPTSRALFLVAAALLVFLSAWWIVHDGPEGAATPTKTQPHR